MKNVSISVTPAPSNYSIIPTSPFPTAPAQPATPKLTDVCSVTFSAQFDDGKALAFVKYIIECIEKFKMEN